MKNPKGKGNAAERDVVNALRIALKAEGTQIFRTPASGGNKYMERSDVTVKAPLLYRFPFSIECKHVKDWHPGRMFNPRKAQETAWTEQVYEANVANNKLIKDVYMVPMLIPRGNGVPSWVFMATKLIDEEYPEGRGFLPEGLYALYSAFMSHHTTLTCMIQCKYGTITWLGVPFADFCAMLESVTIDGKANEAA